MPPIPPKHMHKIMIEIKTRNRLDLRAVLKDFPFPEACFLSIEKNAEQLAILPRIMLEMIRLLL